MNGTTNQTPEAPLSDIFDEKWDVFTVDTMDQKTIDTIFQNANPPKNASHTPTMAGIEKAARDFCAENGNELLKAVQLLEGN